MKQEILDHFRIHFKQLKSEIDAYPDDSSLWETRAGISNSAGNLCIHLMGNLNHYIGFVLGQTSYKRDRELEFSIKNLTKKELITRIDKTKMMLEQSFEEIANVDLPYPDGYFDQKGINIKFALIKLITHFNYHLSQINYHRRILFPDSAKPVQLS